MYNVGDKIVHPMHGAGIIDGIDTQLIDGKAIEYYILKLTNSSMTLMVPVATSDQIGIRRIISAEHADSLISLLHTVGVDENTNWNKRYRDNVSRIKSGDLDEIVRVIKSLTYRDIASGLSTGERKMLHSAKQILFSELMLAKEKTYKEIEKELECALSSFPK